jgi:hypothetical protein
VINCVVKISSTQDVLDHGQRVDATSTLLYEGPAFVAGPSRQWERAAALEGAFGASLYAHTSVDLTNAKTVEIVEHPMQGIWDVVSVSPVLNEWRFVIGRRATS